MYLVEIETMRAASIALSVQVLLDTMRRDTMVAQLATGYSTQQLCEDQEEVSNGQSYGVLN